MPKSHRFWDRIADRYDRTSERHAAYRNMRLAHMRGFLGADDTVLDFACATGRLAFDLAPHVAHVLGIDLSEGMIARAKAKLADGAPANVRFDAMDLFSGDLDGRRFTVVTAFNVFHLLDDPARYLERLRALLWPEGLLISETPCMGRKPWFVRTPIKLAGLTGWLPRVRTFTEEKLEALVASQGFEIIEAKLLDEELGDPWVVARKT